MQHITTAFKRVTAHRFTRYVFVGGTTFAIDIGLLIILHSVMGINVFVAATISYWSSIAFNFFMNRAWTFDAGQAHIGKHLVFYLSLLAINYAFSIGFIAVGVHIGLHYTVAKILATGIQIIWTYLAYKKIIFRHDHDPN